MTTPDALKRQAGVKKTRPNRAGGDGNEFPLRVAKVTRVDPKKMVVDLITFTGNNDTYENVALTFPNAGARHFMGAVPEVNDLCIIDYSPAESGTSRRPYIVGWLIPGTDVAYDWVSTQLTNPEELDYTPKAKEALEGVYGVRRHKLRQMEAGNIVASSSQGSDIILSEDLLLANRRGNELLLRDSDQSLIIRSLQQFHAGSGFRVYSGMVQRDANLLPRQLFSDGTDYASPKQLDDAGNPLPIGDLEDSALEDGQVKFSEVFNNDNLYMGGADPKDILSRGFFIDAEGVLKKPDALGGSTYGGKSFYRVSKDLSNSVPDNGAETFTEYRIEVSHTADGTLPVTEQTDGFDIDRLPKNQVSDNIDDVDPNSSNKSINAPMVEMILGTAIGNDPINDPESYGVPLIATMFDENGQYAPGISAAPPGTPIASHLAWLVKVNNPTSNTAPAFIGITKGGALKQYFPGVGSDTFEEYYERGRVTGVGVGQGGISQKIICEGGFQVYTKKGDDFRNSGISLDSIGGINLYAEGSNMEGSLLFGQNVNVPAAQQIGISLGTPHSILAQAGKELRLQGSKRIFIEETNVINMTSNNAININTDSASMNFNSWDTTVQGNTTLTSSGTLSMQFNGSPAFSTIGTVGGVGIYSGGVDSVISVESKYGGRAETYTVGTIDVKTLAGSIGFAATTNAAAFQVIPDIGPGASASISAGPEVLGSEVNAGLGGVDISTLMPFGGVEIRSIFGDLKVEAKTGVEILNLGGGVKITSPSMKIAVPAPGYSGAVLTDGCKDPLTGRSFLVSGCRGVPRFRVGI